MSKIEQMETELRKRSQTERRHIREWLDDVIEVELEFTAWIRRAQRDMAEGKGARVRH